MEFVSKIVIVFKITNRDSCQEYVQITHQLHSQVAIGSIPNPTSNLKDGGWRLKALMKESKSGGHLLSLKEGQTIF